MATKIRKWTGYTNLRIEYIHGQKRKKSPLKRPWLLKVYKAKGAKKGKHCKNSFKNIKEIEENTGFKSRVVIGVLQKSKHQSTRGKGGNQ